MTASRLPRVILLGYQFDAMPLILVTPLSALPEMLRTYQPSHLISLLSPEFMIETPGGFPAGRHLRVAVHDICEPVDGKHHPAEEHITAIFEFARGWDGKQPMIVHCWAGVSRSMAAAYAILCARFGPGAEFSTAQEIRARAPHAYPNRAIVRLADSVLGRQGTMIKAVEEMGPGTMVEEGTPVEFPLAAFAL
jgi:predicted protein tyrosine phosphatase